MAIELKISLLLVSGKVQESKYFLKKLEKHSALYITRTESLYLLQKFFEMINDYTIYTEK